MAIRHRHIGIIIAKKKNFIFIRLLLPPNCDDERARIHESGGTSLIVVRKNFCNYFDFFGRFSTKGRVETLKLWNWKKVKFVQSYKGGFKRSQSSVAGGDFRDRLMLNIVSLLSITIVTIITNRWDIRLIDFFPHSRFIKNFFVHFELMWPITRIMENFHSFARGSIHHDCLLFSSHLKQCCQYIFNLSQG